MAKDWGDSMEKNIYLAGVGGQGLQVAGKVIAAVADAKGLKVTYSPKYGVEKRGGLTSCYIVISDGIVGNPRKKLQDVLLVMEQKAYLQFHNNVRRGGIIIVNSTLISEKQPEDSEIYRKDIPFHDICLELGNTKVISAVILGVLASVLHEMFPEKEELKNYMLQQLKSKPDLLELNNRAFDVGYEYAENNCAV